eukprot:GHVU01161342.1.p1 GENE.GHVU01161342.1~~GHVU01161342.1.p1  ORF type:complete len:109 (-),score=5.58 GHVU01161342.1:153-479(-)
MSNYFEHTASKLLALRPSNFVIVNKPPGSFSANPPLVALLLSHPNQTSKWENSQIANATAQSQTILSIRTRANNRWTHEQDSGIPPKHPRNMYWNKRLYHNALHVSGP